MKYQNFLESLDEDAEKSLEELSNIFISIFPFLHLKSKSYNLTSNSNKKTTLNILNLGVDWRNRTISNDGILITLRRRKGNEIEITIFNLFDKLSLLMNFLRTLNCFKSSNSNEIYTITISKIQVLIFNLLYEYPKFITAARFDL